MKLNCDVRVFARFTRVSACGRFLASRLIVRLRCDWPFNSNYIEKERKRSLNNSSGRSSADALIADTVN